MQFFRIQYTGEKAMPSTVSFMQSPHVLCVALPQWFIPGIWYYGLEADSLFLPLGIFLESPGLLYKVNRNWRNKNTVQLLWSTVLILTAELRQRVLVSLLQVPSGIRWRQTWVGKEVFHGQGGKEKWTGLGYARHCPIRTKNDGGGGRIGSWKGREGIHRAVLSKG